MSPRTLLVSGLVVATCLLFAVVTLAMLSAERDPAISEGPPVSLTGEMPASATTEACEEPADRTQVGQVPLEAARISRC